MISIRDIDVRGKRVLIRSDLNVPLDAMDGKAHQRVRAAMETIRYALSENAAVLVVSHVGRPVEGDAEERYSLKPMVAQLSSMLDAQVAFATEWIHGVDLRCGAVTLGENVRFLPGEYRNDGNLARRMAELCDVFVMDAFGAAHRSQASTVGVCEFAPISCAGLLLEHEVLSLETALRDPARPVVSIVGGAKVADKLLALQRLAELSDVLIVGGGIANTFLAASGKPVGNSLCEPELFDIARAVIDSTEASGCELPLPVDAVVARSIDDQSGAAEKPVEETASTDMIFDIGNVTSEVYRQRVMDARTIIWNGPVGVFERRAFSGGTEALVHAVTKSAAHSAVGGGDTLAAVDRFGSLDDITYASTGGGAFLEYVQGNALPAIEMLESVARHVEVAESVRA